MIKIPVVNGCRDLLCANERNLLPDLRHLVKNYRQSEKLWYNYKGYAL